MSRLVAEDGSDWFMNGVFRIMWDDALTSF